MNDSLHDCIICATGISAQDEKDIKLILKKLGGEYSPNFTSAVTHLIAKDASSTPKYEIAMKKMIPIVDITWLFDCLKKNEKIDVESYVMLPFKKCVISATQFGEDERMEIKHLVELNGGVFSKDLDRIRSTHLVAIDTTGSKYVHAVTWGNVRVVSKDWIQQCNIAKRKLPESDFRLNDRVNNQLNLKQVGQAGLQTAASGAPNAPNASKRRFEEVKDYTGHADAERESTSTSVVLSGMDTRLPSLPTESSSEPSSSCSSYVLDVRRVASLLSPFELPLKPDAARKLVSKGQFRHEVFWINGFSEKHTYVLLHLIVCGGGVRHHVLSDQVTKALLGPEASDRAKASVLHHPLGTQCIRLEWLLDAVQDIQFQDQAEAGSPRASRNFSEN